ncbi:hypothetical protein JQ615_26520 [Bradyrhizobium jicamae]|uniref:Uncharacterized protein n=1 Tax=Bradyrhizobium jicamae TaxID=280332 RepID=A0ABS5FQ61_9BRAD|nr:hypothetical protein [Bradyrhizobium jicamae]MBR0798948.1 hypothetical protein [Bradyrhizobium jicamae]
MYLPQTTGGELESHLAEAAAVLGRIKAENAKTSALKEGATADEAAAIAAAAGLGDGQPSDEDLADVAAMLGGTQNGRRITCPGPRNKEISVVFLKLFRDENGAIMVADFFVYGSDWSTKKFVHQKLGTVGDSSGDAA